MSTMSTDSLDSLRRRNSWDMGRRGSSSASSGVGTDDADKVRLRTSGHCPPGLPRGKSRASIVPIQNIALILYKLYECHLFCFDKETNR
jgi:hypothetical protein